MSTVQKITTKLGATVTLIEPDSGRPFFRYEAKRPGIDTFSYKITQAGQQDTAEVIVEVKEDGTFQLQAVNDDFTLTEGQTIKMDVLIGDKYEPDEEITLDFYSGGSAISSAKTFTSRVQDVRRAITTPELGAGMELIIPPKGDRPYFTYQANRVGKEKIQYVISQLGKSSIGIIDITVEAQKIILVAKDDSYTLDQLETRTLPIFEKDDYDTTKTLLVYFPGLVEVGESVQKGTTFSTRSDVTIYNTSLGNKLQVLTNRAGVPIIEYTAIREGSEVIDYTIEQGDQRSSAKIGIKVNSVVQADDDSFTLIQGKAHQLDVVKDDKYNDQTGLTLEFADLPGEPIRENGIDFIYTPNLKAKMSLIKAIKSGELPYFTYEPYNVGTEAIKYRIRQFGSTSIGTITIEVTPKKVELQAVSESFNLLPNDNKSTLILANDTVTAGVPLQINFPDLAPPKMANQVNGITQTIYQTTQGNKLTLFRDRFGFVIQSAYQASDKETVDEVNYELQQNEVKSAATATFRVEKEFEVIAVDDSFTVQEGESRILNAIQGDTFDPKKPLTVDFYQKQQEEFEEAKRVAGTSKTITTPLKNVMRLVIPESNELPYFEYEAANTGDDTIQYIISQEDKSDIGTISIRVPEPAVIAVDDELTMVVGQTRSIPYLANDTYNTKDQAIITFLNAGTPSNEETYITDILRNTFTTRTIGIKLPPIQYTARNQGTDEIRYRLNSNGQAEAKITVNVLPGGLTYLTEVPTGNTPVSVWGDTKSPLLFVNEVQRMAFGTTGGYSLANLISIGPDVTINSGGEIIKDIQASLKRPHHIAVSADRKTGFLTDRLTNTVFIFQGGVTNNTAILLDLDQPKVGVIGDQFLNRSTRVSEVNISKEVELGLPIIGGLPAVEDVLPIKDLPDVENPPIKDLPDKEVPPYVEEPNPIKKDVPLPLAPFPGDADAFAVLNNKTDQVIVYANRNNLFDQRGLIYIPSGGFNRAEGMAFDSDSNLYVADTGNDRIMKFNETGLLLITWGGEGTGLGQFKKPADIAVGEFEGRKCIFVVDTGNSRVQVFDELGNFRNDFGAEGLGEAFLNGPRGIFYSADENHLLVSDSGNGRVMIYKVGLNLFDDLSGPARNVGYIKYHGNSSQ